MNLLRKAVLLSNIVAIGLLFLLSVGMLVQHFQSSNQDQSFKTIGTSRRLAGMLFDYCGRFCAESSGGGTCQNDDDCGGFERGFICKGILTLFKGNVCFQTMVHMVFANADLNMQNPNVVTRGKVN